MTDRIVDRKRFRDAATLETSKENAFHTRTTPGTTRFARAIARSEFGRHYWDDRMEQELIASRKRKPKPKPKR